MRREALGGRVAQRVVSIERESLPGQSGSPFEYITIFKYPEFTIWRETNHGRLFDLTSSAHYSPHFLSATAAVWGRLFLEIRTLAFGMGPAGRIGPMLFDVVS